MVSHRGNVVKENFARRAFVHAHLFWVISGSLIFLFFVAPWSVQTKAHAFLHGLCGQQLTHSFVFNGQPLPYDARCTGIYSGFVLTAVYLVVRRRYRAMALPAKRVLGMLVLFVAILGIDGVNSFLVDIQAPHLYTPDNRLRLLTGLLCGITLAATICFLLASTLWIRPEVNRSSIEGIGDLIMIVLIQLPFVLLVLSDKGWLFDWLAILLVVATVMVIGSLMLVAVVLARRLDNQFASTRQLQTVASMALIFAVCFIGILAGGRYLLEALVGLPPPV